MIKMLYKHSTQYKGQMKKNDMGNASTPQTYIINMEITQNFEFQTINVNMPILKNRKEK